MAKFKEGTPELEMLNDMVIRDTENLKKELHPDELGKQVKMADGIWKMITLVEHSARRDLYDELGADVKKYEELIRKEMDNIRRK